MTNIEQVKEQWMNAQITLSQAQTDEELDRACKMMDAATARAQEILVDRVVVGNKF